MLEPHAICRDAYDKTRQLYADVAPELGSAALGFRVLYSPPISDAPVLFLGLQPGGREDDLIAGLAEGQHEGWPPCSDYATAEWRLAKKVRKVWDVGLVSRCSALNLVFFRAPSVDAWRRVPRHLRHRLETFSLEQAERIVAALKPGRLIIFGLGTFDWVIKNGRVGQRGDRDRILTKHGELWGRAATGVVHLSGSRISTADLERLRRFFSSEAQGA